MNRPAAAMPVARDALQEWQRHALPGLAPWVLAGWALLVAAAVLLRPILPVDETRYLAVAWEMWRSGDAWSLRLNGEAYSHKPPLLFWMIQAGWSLGGPDTASPRLLAGLAALAALGLAARLAQRVAMLDDGPAPGPPPGLVALVTGSTLGWMAFTGAVMFDLLLACCVLLALNALVDAVRSAGRGRARDAAPLAPWSVFIFALGAGLLAKGPVMMLHVLPGALLAPWWGGAVDARAWYRRLGAATLVGLVPLAAWALTAAQAGGEAFARELLWEQTWSRIATTTHHLRPAWFYLAALPLLLLPWTMMPAVWRGLRARWRDGASLSGRRFIVAWVVPVLLAFSAFRGKQAQYLLPLVPAFAIVLVHALGAAWGADLRTRVLRSAAGSWLAMLALVAVLGRALGPDYDVDPVSRRIAAFEAAGAPVAQLGKYHGQFHFAGRLRGRIEELPTADALRAWARAHPSGAVVNYCRREKGRGADQAGRSGAAPGGGDLLQPGFEQGFRSRRLQLWRAADFARLPASEDGCGYGTRASARSGAEGNKARLASAAAASVALAHSGAVQPNQSGSSSKAAAIDPTRSVSTRRAKARSSSAQPTPTTVAVMSKA